MAIEIRHPSIVVNIKGEIIHLKSYGCKEPITIINMITTMGLYISTTDVNTKITVTKTYSLDVNI